MSLVAFLKPDFNTVVDLRTVDKQSLYAAAIVDNSRGCMEHDCDAIEYVTANPQHELYLVKLDHNLYQHSKVCARMVKVVSKRELFKRGIMIHDNCQDGTATRIGGAFTTREDLQAVNDAFDLADVNMDVSIHIITFIDEPIDLALLTIESITDMKQFYVYMLFADRYMLDIPYICANFEYTFWLASIRERQKDIWRANNILLTPIEQKYYTRKFEPVEGGAAAAEAYPVGNVMIPKMVNLVAPDCPELLTHTELRELFVILNRNGAGVMVNKILISLGVSVQYCDLIFCNKEVLSMRGIVIPSSLVFYAFRVLYLEELAMYNNKRAPGRFILDLDTASVLPTYPDHIGTHSPYMVTIAKGVVNESRSLLIPTRFSGSRKLVTMDAFRSRYEIYTGGLLRGITWEGSVTGADSTNNNNNTIDNPVTENAAKYKLAFSGSGMCACAINTPLESGFDTFAEYVEEYYPSRKNMARKTVDVVENYDTLYSFDSDGEASGSDGDNIRSVRGENTRDENDAKIQHYDYSDIDLMVECSFEFFDQVVKKVFAEISVNMHCELERVETENKHKWTIKGPERTIDVFHVDSILAVIVKYHFGCVRAWYDGTNVYVFPSFITAAMTGINMDIRWTSNRKDPRDGVLKYFQRGFATLLNHEDKTSLIDYINKGAGDGTHSWPKHEYVGDQGYGYRRMRFRRLPIFAKSSISSLFNPSVSRIGIHECLDTMPQRANLQQMFIGMKKRTKKDDADYKSIGGKILLPTMCPSLGIYL
jgi:hypothetical protein